jgi:polysaccharide biosynthesis transport protein
LLRKIMSLYQLWVVLRARWWVVVAVTLSVLMITAIWTWRTDRIYSATASLIVDAKSVDPIVGLTQQSGPVSNLILTQIDILKSDRVARKVAEAAGLMSNQSLRERWMTSAGGRGTYESWLTRWLKQSMEVRPTRDSNVIEVSYNSPDPKFAAMMANWYAKAHLETLLELRVSPARQYTTFFDEQLKKAKDNLEQNRLVLSTFLRDKGLLNADEKFDVEMNKLNDLSQQLNGMRSATADSQSRLNQASGAQGDKVQDVLMNPMVNSIKSELLRAQAQIQDAQSRFGPEHPTLIALKASAGELQARYDSEVRRVLGGVNVSNQVNKSREQQVSAAFEAQRARVLQLKQLRDEAASLEQDVTSAQRVYDSLVARVSQTSLESETTQTNVSLLSEADPPADPASPNVFLNLLSALALGGLGGCLLALVLESRQRKVRSTEDAALMFGIPVLADMSHVNFAQLTQASQGKPAESLLQRALSGSTKLLSYQSKT